MHDALLGRNVVERAFVLETHELLPSSDSLGGRVRLELAEPPGAVDQAVLRVRLHRGSDVGGERPRSRRPDGERLLRAPAQREAHEERRMGQLGVLVLARLLVLRE